MSPEELAAIKTHLASFRGCPDCRTADLVAEVERLQQEEARRQVQLDEYEHLRASIVSSPYVTLHPATRPAKVAAELLSSLTNWQAVASSALDTATQFEAEAEQLRARLAELDDTPHHVLDVRADGWTLKHPLSCRPNLFDCPVNQACQGFDGPPADVGRYVVDLDGDGELRIGEEVRADG